MKKKSNHLITCLFIVMFLIFTKLFFNILLQDFIDRTVISIIMKLLFLSITIIIYYLIYHLLSQHISFLEKYKILLLTIYCITLLTLQLYFGNLLRVEPLYDFSSIYHGAMEWIVTGSFSSFYEYFYYYPNNLGALTFFAYIFRFAATFGITDFYFVGILVNCLLSIGMIVLTFICCYKKFSVVDAFYSLVLFAVCPPMYILGAIFYTDTLTMIFPIAIYTCYLFYKEDTKHLKTSILFGFIISILALLGYLLKPTVLIMCIAILIELLFLKKWKKAGILIVQICLILFIGNSLFSNLIYTNHLEKDIAAKMNTPKETWVAMGLNEQFGFSGDDTEFSRGIEDPDERKEKMRELIQSRVQEKGFWGLLKHFKHKGVTAFSDGSFGLSQMFIYGFVKPNVLEEYITSLGSHYDFYWNICTFSYYANLFYLSIFLLLALWKSQQLSLDRISEMAVPLALFGLYLFLLMWEVHTRYTVNFYSIIVLLSVYGMKYLYQSKFFIKKY